MKPILSIVNGQAELRLGGFVVQNEDKEFYDWLGYDSVCPRDVVDALQSLGGKPVTVKVDGYGGSMYAGSTIYTEFMEYSGAVTFKITGLAASAMSTITMASAKEGNRCLMSPMAMMVIHNAQSGADGDYRDMEHAAERLKVANQTAIHAYQKKTGMDETEIQAMMDKESWVEADEALEKGLIDEIMFSDDAKSKSKIPEGVVNELKRRSRDIYNSIPVPSRQAMEKFKAQQHPPKTPPKEQNEQKPQTPQTPSKEQNEQKPQTPPTPTEDDQIAYAQAMLEIENLRFEGMKE